MAARPELARRVLLYWMDGMIAFIAVAFAFMLLGLVSGGTISAERALLAGALLLTQFALFPFILRAAYDDKPRPTVLLVISGLAMLASVALVPPGLGASTWEIVAGLWLAGLAISVPWRVSVAFGVALAAITVPVAVVVSGLPLAVALVGEGATLVVTPLATWLLVWLWRTIKEAHESQEAKSRLAVAEERLRFARDLHDLLGHSLSVISIKSELAAKLSAKNTGRAAGEMSQVRELAGVALAEVQAAVEGYRSLDLSLELATVRATLEAAGARCTVKAHIDDLTPAARTLLAWAVREGATNILKHSTATRCAITIDRGVLEMRNNGVKGPRRTTGSGLRGLSERLTAAGGTFSASVTDADSDSGEFLLRAAVPA
ncbi:sensor histidine kinase [Nonomuraea sp. NPDC050394]|uniref:sensor histidine kinase n=1 Tax=Nonomuraea sp. NPDC050394 TaxID=3364363 RepID=UPI0037BAF970